MALIGVVVLVVEAFASSNNLVWLRALRALRWVLPAPAALP